MLSIIPKNIATQVRDGIWGYIQKHKLNESRKPFKELFVEKHDTVSILFADICGFTPLTTTLSVSKLVETLNDLFGKFDEAAEVCKGILLYALANGSVQIGFILAVLL